MANMKLFDQQSIAKRAVQDDIFSSIKGKYSHAVSLAGPNISYYLKLLKRTGIKKATIYENNLTNFFLQLQQHTTVLPAHVLFKDILQAQPDMANTVYDLDFCFSMLKAYDCVKKFAKDSTITTVAVRPVGKDETIALYTKAAFNTKSYGIEPIISTEWYDKYDLLTSNGDAILYSYKDTSSMLVFSNIK